MKKNIMQWIKYIAVVLTVIVMAGAFWPGMKAQVNASSVEGGLDGNDQTPNTEAMLSIPVSYILGYDDASWEGDGPATTISPIEGFYYVTEIIPVKEGFTFVGWMREDGTVYKAGDVLGNASDFGTDSKLEFTAKWEENKDENIPDWSITVVYDLGAEDVTWIDNIPNEPIKPNSGGYYITIPTEMPSRYGYNFLGWQSDIENDDKKYQGGTIEISANNIKKETVAFTAQWQWDGKTIVPNETLKLTTRTPYSLSSGTWTVNGDGYEYKIPANGMNVYVGTNGDYTFTKN